MATTKTQPMETEATEEGPSTSALSKIPKPEETKRKLVDVDGKEIPDPKRARAVPETTMKINAIKLIIHWHEFLKIKFKVSNDKNIDLIADITSCIWTIHSKLRQDINNVGSYHSIVKTGFEFKVGTNTANWEDLEAKMVEIAGYYGFVYNATAESRVNIGTLGSLLALFTCFRARSNEVRTGTTQITLRKEKGVVQSMPLEQFGLAARHAVLTSGCTYNPTLQSSMKQALGPMTIAINLCMQRDKVFIKAWKNAFVTAFKLFPLVNEIADTLAGTKNGNDTLMCMIGDIALWGTTRASNKATFPVALLLSVCRKGYKYKLFFNGQTTPNTPLDNETLPEEILTMDFSGIGAFRLWHAARYLPFSIRRTAEMTDRTAQEFIFHSTWGTQKEDLGLLKWMTGHDFQTRRQIGNQFQHRGEGVNSKEFTLIPFKRICKLSSASQTDFLSGGKGQISRAPTFSGKCAERVDLGGELYKTLLEARDKYDDGTREKSKIIARLTKLKESIRERVEQENIIRFGTTDFHVPTNYKDYGPIETEKPTLSKIYFYGQGQ